MSTPAMALAGMIRKPSPGAARADKLIADAAERGARMNSPAAAIGVMQADIHTLCDQIARLEAPTDDYDTVSYAGIDWIVGLADDEDADWGTVVSVWVNGEWIEAELFGDRFAGALSDAYRDANPAPEPDSDEPCEYAASAAEDRWIADRDAVASQ